MAILIISGIIVVVCVALFVYILLQRDEEMYRRNESTYKRQAEQDVRQQLDSSQEKINSEQVKYGLSQLEVVNKDIKGLKDAIHEHVIGMDELINGLLVSLLAGGHVLVEGVPGLAKTKTIHSFSDLLGLAFARIQFTPDMLPSDLVGVEIFNDKKKEFEVKIGPIVNNIILADEINRTTPKVQSALLESMQEQQVSLGGKTYKLPQPFMVLATQNPIEQEGTYPLPEAQVDRFMCKMMVGYPTNEQEKKILTLLEGEKAIRKKDALFTMKKLIGLRKKVNEVTLSDEMKLYITKLVGETRSAEYSSYIQYGSSPRGSIALMQTAKAVAFVQGRNFVTHEDIYAMVLPALRHRILLKYNAKIDGVSTDQLLMKMVRKLPLV